MCYREYAKKGLDDGRMTELVDNSMGVPISYILKVFVNNGALNSSEFYKYTRFSIKLKLRNIQKSGQYPR